MQRPSSDPRERVRNCRECILRGRAVVRGRSGMGTMRKRLMLRSKGYGVGAKLVTSGSGEDMGHHHCSLTPPFPNKTWFHISLLVSPLPFSIAVVFIIHDISFPTPPARTRSSYTPASRTYTPRWALSWSQEGPACPATKAALSRPSLPTSHHSLRCAPPLSVTGEIDMNRDEKRNKTSFPPLPSSPARTTSSCPLNTPSPNTGLSLC